MPKLSELTDYDPMGSYSGLPVDDSAFDPNQKKVYITGEPEVAKEPSVFSSNIDKIINSLFRDDEKRLQLWPEKVVREGFSMAKRVANNEVPRWAIDPDTGDVHTSPEMIEGAQSMAALAGTGGLAGTTEGTLGATPFLRPALKYKDKLYKGKEGQQHMDVIPEALYPEFQKMAMSGEDISHYNFGFVNDKGHFLDREKALRYAIDTGLVDKYAGQFGALTSTLLADSTKPGMAIEAIGKSNAPTFFSAVEHNVAKIPQTKMTGDQWLGTLSNKPGVKPEELDWTGLKSFLEENKGKPVTKGQIEEHLAANKVELKEVSKGEPSWKNLNQKQQDEIVDKFNDLPKEVRDNFDGPHDFYEQARVNNPEGLLNSGTKYHSYQLPGGNNYREMLLTLPINKEKYAKSLIDPAVWERMSVEQRNEFMSYPVKGDGVTTYKSSHWDEPNILAHVRMNDRDIGGKKSLHLEEIQSDWHQQGRDRGYKLSDKEYQKLDADYKQALKDRNQYGFNSPEYKEGTKKAEALGKQLLESRNGLPDAPFKKSWHELALKRMIREAAEKGYDRLSWTPGEAQAARYDLSKSVDSLKYEPSTGALQGNKNGKSVISQHSVTPEKLPDFVGKEVAKKLMEQQVEGISPRVRELSGVDLKIGGEGMKGFYDQIIPKALEKLGKEHGVKVKKGSVNDKFIIKNKYGIEARGGNTEVEAKEALKSKPANEGWKVEKENNPVHYIDIPQSLKDTALHKGFPLFSNKYMFVPVDYEPEFKK